MTKNYFLSVVAVIIIVSAFVLRISDYSFKKDTNTEPKVVNISSEEEVDKVDLVGNDRDEHGCIGSAGYSWCESRSKCLRIWEEDCPAIIEEDSQEDSKKAEVEVVVTSPLPGSIVSSPLEIVGTARGYWFFEASFPIVLETANGEVIASHYATSQADWMTEDFVPFAATIDFSTEAESGNLIIKKDNPSGLPENDAQISIPVKFK
jgi:hypothetical protein